jgi:signal transduction histidine kinase
MPERAGTGGAQRDRRARWLPAALLAAALTFPQPAISAPAVVDIFLQTVAALDRHEIVSLSLTLGVLFFAVVTAIALVRTRSHAATKLAETRHEAAAAREVADRALALLLAEPQVVVVWRDHKGEPEILGDAMSLMGLPATRRVLAFGAWLDADQAHVLEAATDALRKRGQTFSMTLVSNRGHHVEAAGRPIGGAAVLRLKEMTGAKLDHAALAERHQRLERDLEQLRALLEMVPAPIWLRDEAGRLAFANRAYAVAVEAKDPADAVAREMELLDRPTREEAAQARADERAFAKRVPVVVAGQRRVVDVIEFGNARGAAGIGFDATEAATVRADLSRIVAAHRRTLDQLATAVAIFGADQRIVFHNAAYRSLFKLDAAFLDERPSDGAVLDRLRNERKLPEQVDFRGWKAELFEAYRSPEPKEHVWHLPDGRILRVVTSPNPEGGVTYLFDDISERIALESRYNTVIHTQSETLDALNEAVAVFGSDGRLKLHNPVFERLWRLSAKMLTDNPHIDAVAGWCAPLVALDAERRTPVDPWQAIKRAITAIERRDLVTERIERVDGTVIDCAAVPLPDGGTLVTFRDVTDSVRVERALVERNEALLQADALKNAFVHNVSYELRSPLTTIIGFAQLLTDAAIGPLNDKQRDYLGHINESSAALLAIIDDILDLATIDAGAMTLELGQVDVRATLEAAADGVRDRLTANELKLDLRVPRDVGHFVADGKRVRQVLFNLLSNAIGFSPHGGTVTIEAERRAASIAFRVTDGGPGIPPELKDRIFGRFESHPLGSKHRGPGLGLSIVRALIELHHGTVAIDSEPGRGTVVTCTFPTDAAAGREAAE